MEWMILGRRRDELKIDKSKGRREAIRRVVVRMCGCGRAPRKQRYIKCVLWFVCVYVCVCLWQLKTRALFCLEPKAT